MDFHALARKELQTLCKKNKIPANLSNAAMADALGKLVVVEGVGEMLHSHQFEAGKTSNESPERSDLTSPHIPTGGRPSRRRNVVFQESSTVKPMPSARRTNRRSHTDEAQCEEIQTPSRAQTSRKKVPLNSIGKKIDSRIKKCAEEKGDVSATPAQLGLTSQRRRLKKEETTVTQVFSARRSARLAKEKGEMLTGEGNETLGLIQMDLVGKSGSNVSACMEEGPEVLDEISGITGLELNISEKEESDEKGEAAVLSEPKQDLYVSHKAELLDAIEVGGSKSAEKEESDKKGEAEVLSEPKQDLYVSREAELLLAAIEVGGSKSAAKETNDVEIEITGDNTVNEAELMDNTVNEDIKKEEEMMIIHNDAEADSKYTKDENIEDLENSIIIVQQNAIEVPENTTGDNTVNEDGLMDNTVNEDIIKEEEMIIHNDAEADSEYIVDENIEEDLENRIIIVQQNAIEVPENQASQEVPSSETEITIVSTQEISWDDHVAFKDNALDLSEYSVLESGDYNGSSGVAPEAEIQKGIDANTEMVQTIVDMKGLNLVEPSDGSHDSKCDPLVADMIREEDFNRSEINLIENAELELQQTCKESGTQLDKDNTISAEYLQYAKEGTEAESAVVTATKDSVGGGVSVERSGEVQSPYLAPINAASETKKSFKPGRSTPNRDSATKKMCSVVSDNKENIVGSGSKLILTKEKPKKAKSSIADLEPLSLRKLNKLVKAKLADQNADKANAGTPGRSALKALPANR